LILDEPTNALEQTARDIFIDYLNAQEKTKIIVFSTHDQHAISQLKAKKLIFGANPVVGLQDIL
jgi:ABC-type multidrug transport system ATPase subunit